MADKYNKLEPKVPKEVLYSLIGFVVIIIALFIIITPTNPEKIYSAYRTTKVTSDFTEDHPFYELSYKQLTKKISSEKFVFVFIGAPDSEAAVAYIGAFQKYFESYDVEQYVDYIYYYNPTEDDDNFAALQESYEEFTTSKFQAALFINGEYTTKFYSNGVSDAKLMNRAVSDFYKEAVEAIEATA